MKTAESVLHFNTAEDSVKIVDESVDVAILVDFFEKLKVETGPANDKMSSKELSKKRATAKGKVTRAINRLEPLLKQIGAEALKSEVTVDDAWKSLGELFNEFKAIHEEHYKALEKESKEENCDEILLKEDDYFDEVRESCQKIEASLAHFKKLLTTFPEQKALYDVANDAYNSAIVLAQNLTEKTLNKSGDELMADPEVKFIDAGVVKVEVVQKFGKLVAQHGVIKAFLSSSGKTLEEVLEITQYNHNDIVKTHSSIVNELSRIESIKAKLNVPQGPAHVLAPAQRAATAIKLAKVESINFSGHKRDFATFKRDFSSIVIPGRENEPQDIGYRLKQAMPEKDKHLLSNFELNDHEGMMNALEKKFGTTRDIVMEVVKDIDNLKMSKTDQDYIKFVETVEKAARDLKSVDSIEQLANETLLAKIESKLPENYRHDWMKIVADEELGLKSSTIRYKTLMKHLEKTKTMSEAELSNSVISTSSSSKYCLASGKTYHVNVKSSKSSEGQAKKNIRPCFVCSADGATNLESANHLVQDCDVWKNLTQKQKEAKVDCVKHPFSTNGHKTADCKMKVVCKNCGNNHHSLFCFKLSKSHKATTKSSSNGSEVLLKTLIVKGEKHGQNIGVMEDNCSTDNYITHSKAREMKLKGDDILLRIEGINSVKEIDSKVYRVPIRDTKKQLHYIECYGLKDIASDAILPDKASYNKLCGKFNVKPTHVQRPIRIDLLLSTKSNYLMSDSVMKVKDGMKLYTGPLGKTFAGSDVNLTFNEHVKSYPSRAIPILSSVRHSRVIKSLSDKEILKFFKEESIGAECNPKCGNCECGKCALGSKPMSIKDEKEYAKFRKNMFLDEVGTEDDPGPYWRTKYPWNIPREDLVDNFPAVFSTMKATAKKLENKPEWREIYDQQLRNLTENKFSREVDKSELDEWIQNGGKVYYISHQMVEDPSSKSTPIRTVFNSSQTYKGYSLNSSWDLGPDMTGSLHGIFLRFREDLVAAQGDIRKHYYNVRVTKEEEFIQLYIWKFKGEDKIRTFAMTRLVMGNKPSANCSQIALHETANLGDNDVKFPDAVKALKEDSYVDNTFTTAVSHDEIRRKIDEIENVAKQGGFFYKPWIVSGDDVPIQSITSPEPKAAEEKVLGMFWDVKTDRIFVQIRVEGKRKNFSISLSSIIDNPKLKLTLRECLSVHAKAFDPIGLVLPLKMNGNLLFRKTLQFLSNSIKTEDSKLKNKLPWDCEIVGEFKDRWLDYFTMLFSINEILFPRSVKPANTDVNLKPALITFSDGNENAYGTVAYVLWTLEDGSKDARLLMAKAKLGPLLQKGETVKNELAGATFAARVKSWIIQHSSIEFGEHIPFLDSRIVQDMIKKESYNLNTFAGLRVKEISAKTDVSNWQHISSKDNYVADILTKGATPDKLREGSIWQQGPDWLKLDRSHWPVTQVTLDSNERQVAKSFEKVSKSFKSKSKLIDVNETDFDSIDALISRNSSLSLIVNVVAHILRLVGRDKSVSNVAACQPQGELHHGPLCEDGGQGELRMGPCTAISMMTRSGELHKGPDENVQIKPVTASERDDALKYLILHEQAKIDVKKFSGFDVISKEFKLSSEKIISLLVLKSRVQNFPIKFSNEENYVYALPPGVFAKRLAQFFHDKYHKDIDTVCCHIRKEFWIPGLRRIVTKIDMDCKFCLILRKKVSSQLMGSMPLFRSQINKPFISVNCDLFGPITIKDAVVKRGARVHSKCWGVLFVCTVTRAVYIDVAVDYSTQSILHCVRRLIADKGEVKRIISDPGTQLKGAATELINMRKGWNEDELIRFGSKHGIDWSFVMPSSQHQNGAVEILIKIVKGVMKSLMEAIGTTVLFQNELFTLFKETANLVNQRPIGLKPNKSTDPEFLSPNSLLLGRCSDRVSSGPFQSKDAYDDKPSSDKTRFLLVQKIVDQFWRVWTKLYFPTLLRRQKWHHKERNLKIGDVCVLKDLNALRGEWRLCRVVDVFPDANNVVRNVEIVVPPPSLDSTMVYKKGVAMIKMKRHVNNLIVIVPSEDEEDHDELGHGGECKIEQRQPSSTNQTNAHWTVSV